MCQYEAHLGPVHALHRHPQLPKIFLTVGDWTTHVWTEDIRDSPILTLKLINKIIKESQFIKITIKNWSGIRMSSCWQVLGAIPDRLSFLQQQRTVHCIFGIFLLNELVPLFVLR